MVNDEIRQSWKCPASWGLKKRQPSSMQKLSFDCVVPLEKVEQVIISDDRFQGPKHWFAGSQFHLYLKRDASEGSDDAWTLGVYLRSSEAMQVDYSITCQAMQSEHNVRESKNSSKDSSVVGINQSGRGWRVFFPTSGTPSVPAMSQWQPQHFAPWVKEEGLHFTVTITKVL